MLAQHIIVFSDDRSHEEVVRAAAGASVISYLKTKEDHSAIWAQWLAGPFTKVVRRAKTFKEYERIKVEFPGWTFYTSDKNPDYTGLHGGTYAFATIPLEDSALPKSISRTQVANFQRERKGFELWDLECTEVNGDYVVAINPGLEMSTGKTAAQVAHGEFAYYLRYGHWIWDIPRYTYDAEIFAQYANDPDTIKINDAGRTEIEPGSLTVVIKRLK